MWSYNLSRHSKDHHNNLFPVENVKHQNELNKAKPFEDERELQLTKQKWLVKDIL